MITVPEHYRRTERFGRSRTSNVIHFGTNQKLVRDFLLVHHSNLGPILYRIEDTAYFLCSWVTSPLVHPNFGGVPVASDRPYWGQPSFRYSAVKLFSKYSNLCDHVTVPECCRRTERCGRSRSSKVIDFGINRKRVCDFLLVRHNNLGLILHRFGDIAGFVCSCVTPTPIPP